MKESNQDEGVVKFIIAKKQTPNGTYYQVQCKRIVYSQLV